MELLHCACYCTNQWLNLQLIMITHLLSDWRSIDSVVGGTPDILALNDASCLEYIQADTHTAEERETLHSHFLPRSMFEHLFPPFSRQSPLPTSSPSLWGLLLYVQHSGSSIWWFESQSHSNKLWICVEFASSGDSYVAVGGNDRLCPVLGSNTTPDWISRRKCLHWWRKAVCLVKRSLKSRQIIF